MKIGGFRIVGIRCFDDTGFQKLSPTVNLFTGRNNVGKSTILRSLLSCQGIGFQPADLRFDAENSLHVAEILDAPKNVNGGGSFWLGKLMRGAVPWSSPTFNDMGTQGFLQQTRPHNQLVPILAKRSTPQFSEQININILNSIDGTYQHLIGRIDALATAGHPAHEKYVDAVREIIGKQITTKASANGKVAGFYFNSNDFITLDQMGDGVTELVGMITEICLEQNKIFLIEEPERHLHPSGLKAILALVRDSAGQNQFIIATHSAIVVRELGSVEHAKIFHLTQSENDRTLSSIEELRREPSSHLRVLRDLGYVFGDFGLFDVWLILEESTAEVIFNQILIPQFVPYLRGRLRTFSSAGTGNLEPSVSEFLRTITFVHLEPAYQDRLWIRADGDASGKKAIESLRKRFPTFSSHQCECFLSTDFEKYYPEPFAPRVAEVLVTNDRKARREAKTQLLADVIAWSKDQPENARLAWQKLM